MNIDEKKVKDFTIDAGFLTKPEAEKLYKESSEQGVRFSEYVMNKGVLSEDNVRRIHGYLLGVPFIDLSEEKIPFDVLSIIPEPIARNHNIVAFNKKDNVLEVVLMDIDDLQAIEFISEKDNLKIIPRLGTADSIKSALLQYHKGLKESFGDIIRKEQSVIKMVDTLIRHAVLQKASDIHIEPSEKDVVIRYRINGMLREAMVLPKDTISTVVAHIKNISNLIPEEGVPQEGRLRAVIDGEGISFGISILPVLYGEKIVMKVLREGGSKYSFEELGFQGQALEALYEAIGSKKGMILTTGPKDSGRTTTNYTLIDILNRPEVTVSTIEDPIEYQIKRINQTQTRPEIGFSYADGLRSLMKQDPDIVMVSELLDSETANLAMNIAITGRMVISSLFSNSTSEAIAQLLSMKVENFIISSALNLIVAQRLVRRLGTKREKYNLSKAGVESLRKIVDLDKVMKVLIEEKIVKKGTSWTDVPFYKSKASSEGDGYEGRIGIFEVLKINEAIKELILKNATAEQMSERAKKEGMLTMVEDGVIKAIRGLTTLEEVLKVTF